MWEISITHGDQVEEVLASGVPPKGDGLMLGPRIGSFAGFQKGNWIPKTNLAGMGINN